MARLAHTFGRIRWCTLAVDSASVSFAGAFTFISVFRVEVIRRRADTLARLDATLVGTALGVGDATDLTGSAETFVRVAGEISWTLTIETAWPVETFGSESTSWLAIDSFLTFVNIFAGSIGSGAVTGRAGAITDSTSDGNAFSSSWAGLFASSTVGQQASASYDAVRWLTTTLDGIADVTTLERVAFKAFWTRTVVTAGQIFTNGPEAASWFISRRFKTFVDVTT